MIDVLKRIEQIVKQAKRDIDKRTYDVCLHPGRRKVDKIEIGSTVYFGYVTGSKSYKAPHTRRLLAHERPILEDYGRELFGIRECEINYF